MRLWPYILLAAGGAVIWLAIRSRRSILADLDPAAPTAAATPQTVTIAPEAPTIVEAAPDFADLAAALTAASASATPVKVTTPEGIVQSGISMQDVIDLWSNVFNRYGNTKKTRELVIPILEKMIGDRPVATQAALEAEAAFTAAQAAAPAPAPEGTSATASTPPVAAASGTPTGWLDLALPGRQQP